MGGGPLLLYTTGADSTTAMVLGPSTNFKVGILAGGRFALNARLTAGVQGMIQQLPDKYTQRFALLGRVEGVTAAMFAYGAFVRKSFNTVHSKLTLASDVLSSQVHYVTDGGALLNYCDYWPKCLKSQGGKGCRPEGDVLQEANAYHKSIEVNVGVYHVDPYWYSHTPNGGCDDFFARNWTGSPFHFPHGIKGVGLPMMLFLQAFADPSKNVYGKDFKFEGQSISGMDARAFFTEIFRNMHATGNFML